ncbi:MAG: hypothetical protein AB1921_14070 [Thermodesulfobacteriota bacterium]
MTGLSDAEKKLVAARYPDPNARVRRGDVAAGLARDLASAEKASDRAWDKELAGTRQGRVSLADVARIRREGGSWWDETATDEEKARWQNDREAFLTDHVNSALTQFENLSTGGKGNGSKGGQNLSAAE